MIHYELKPVVFNLDDFCEEIMTPYLWDLLFQLKDRYPLLKITMFTIPLLCSEKWLKMVKQEYPWIEMHYHGSDHKDRGEWIDKTEIQFPFEPYFYRGFKAPWWRMNQRTADALSEMGFVLSVCKGYFDVEGPRVYRFNEGKQCVPMVWHENVNYHSVHSHVQSQKAQDGLPDGDLHKRFLNAFPKGSSFKFISELFQ